MEGDEEEDDIDDLDNEFNFAVQESDAAKLSSAPVGIGMESYSTSFGADTASPPNLHTELAQVPLLVDSEMV